MAYCHQKRKALQAVFCVGSRKYPTDLGVKLKPGKETLKGGNTQRHHRGKRQSTMQGRETIKANCSKIICININ